MLRTSLLLLLATGDYTGKGPSLLGTMTCYYEHHALMSGGCTIAGRITTWILQSGEGRATLQHEAPEFEAAVEQLLWLPATTDNPGPLLLSAGGTPLQKKLPKESCLWPVHAAKT